MFELPESLDSYIQKRDAEFMRMMVNDQIAELRDYVNAIDLAFNREFEDFSTKLAEQAEKLPEHKRGEFYQWHGDTAFALGRRFPALAWQSTFAASYSCLEHELLTICKLLEKRDKHLIGTADLKDKGILLGKTYLEKVCRIDFPKHGSPWRHMVEYNRVRNLIVHNDGRVRDGKNGDQVRAFVKSRKDITIDQYQQIKLSKEFCLHVLEDMRQFFEALFQNIEKQIQ